MAQKPTGHRLTLWIGLAIVLAIAVALIFPHLAMSFEVGGEIFLRLLKMIVVPLVITSVMSGILGLGDVRKLGKPGGAAVGYYLSTTVLAVSIGLVMVNVIQPGVGTIDPEEAAAKAGETELPEREDVGPGQLFEKIALMLVTDNLFAAAAETQLLPLITFSIIFAGMLTTLGRKVELITTAIEQANVALLNFVLLLMRVAPLGIFCLVAARFGEAQAAGNLRKELEGVGWYMAAVLAGLAVHAFLVLPLIYWVFTRRNPYRFFARMARPILTAFSTASSSATLPVTMDAVRKAGVKKKATEFVLPLGATINMDGTALYEAVAAIFIAQVIGIDLTFTQQLTVAVTATLAAIGAAGIPEAGLVTLLIVLSSVGLPLEYLGLILSVDWLLDRFRTATNVWGDSVGASVVQGLLPDDVKLAAEETGA